VIPGIYEGPLSIRESAHAAGHDELPVWITETGWEATTGNAGELEAQRKFVERTLDAMQTRAWWGGIIYYEVSEEHPGGMWPDIHWGLVLRTSDPDASPLDNFQHKPAYDYLKTRLAAIGPQVDAGPGLDDAGATGDAHGGNGNNGDAGTTDPAHPAGCGCHTTRGADALPLLAALALLGRRRRR